jgi:hypothetical protein
MARAQSAVDAAGEWSEADEQRGAARGTILDAQVQRLRDHIPEKRLLTAANLYEDMIPGADFADFLTVPAYEYLD